MMRSKLPLGLLSPEQLEAFADITEQYASGVAHLTTRQDIQVHFIALKRSPAVMEALARAEGLYPEARTYASFGDALADSQVEAVALSTEAATHAALTLEALEAGKDVFVEKPLALTHADGARVVRAARETGRVLLLTINRNTVTRPVFRGEDEADFVSTKLRTRIWPNERLR